MKNIHKVICLLIGSGVVTASQLTSHGLISPASADTLPDRVDWVMDAWLPDADGDDPADRLAIPSLTQPYYNSVFDVHATVSAQDTQLILSTNGNWHLALRRLLDEEFFPANPQARTSNLITTSPPISVAQLESGIVKVGNVMYVDAQPHLAAGPGRVINAIEENGDASGDRIPIITTYGNVILKRAGDDSISGFWDLATIEPGRFASSDPAEGGSYNNYRNSVKDIAVANPRSPDLTAEEIEREASDLQALLFDTEGVATIGPPMHRSVPHMIATGQADAGLFFLHLAVTAMRENPGVFTAVYLSGEQTGETDDPEVLARGQVPLEGNRVPTFSVIRTNVDITDEQQAVRDAFVEALQSEAFTTILTDVGLRRPE